MDDERVRARLSWLVLLPVAAAAGGLVALHAWAPLYLFHQGFPLDDSWIHAVYAREWARSGLLAYNPGVPATGETSPLWALLLGVVHKFAFGASPVALTKMFGFALHVLSAVCLGVALQPLFPERRWLVWSSSAVVALYPNLVLASVSGMEVPLATLVIAGAIAASVRGRPIVLAVLGALAIGARPEAAAIAVVFPFLYRMPSNPRRAFVESFAAAAGGIGALVLLGVRNHAISGRLLPATFYAKANTGSPFNVRLQQVGFGDLLGTMPMVGVPAVLAAFAIISLLLLTRWGRTASERAASAMFLSGVVFCAISFALIPPIDPTSFYHQRYVLPALLPMAAAMPLLVHVVVARSAPSVAQPLTVGTIVVFAAVLIAAWPARAAHLANDTHNIDDVQVAFGQALASSPASDIVWAVDAGAIRFFGAPFVVDTIGLNTPEILGDDRQAFLDRHEPKFLDLFPSWSEVQNERHLELRSQTFATSTPYTVASNRWMRSHVLVFCEPPGLHGRMIVRGRPLAFRCAS